MVWVKGDQIYGKSGVQKIFDFFLRLMHKLCDLPFSYCAPKNWIEMEELKELLQPLWADPRLGPVHICLYLDLLLCSGSGGEWFVIDPAEVMRRAKIHSRKTYYQVMNDLASGGYVEYRPSRNKKSGSRVRMGGVIKDFSHPGKTGVNSGNLRQ